jgi:hypothetical protein
LLIIAREVPRLVEELNVIQFLSVELDEAEPQISICGGVLSKTVHETLIPSKGNVVVPDYNAVKMFLGRHVMFTFLSSMVRTLEVGLKGNSSSQECV